MSMNVVIVAADCLTPYGMGVEACWQGLLSGKTAISRLSRFATGAFMSDYAATVAGLDYHGGRSLVMQMLERLFTCSAPLVPADAPLYLATTKGEIDFLEMSVLSGSGDADESSLERLLEKVAALSGAGGGGLVLSAACTSASAAAARGAALIREGGADCVLVVACDAVTEFVFSGFSSLMALDRQPSRPFDRNRAGLSVGEAAAYLLLMSEERALRERRTPLAELAGWGMSDDANHMTGPSRESEGMIRAIRAALARASLGEERIDLISAHGTGTPYNDAMEMRAFRSLFGERRPPVYSVKGGIGHTMGAAGLVELIVAVRALSAGVAPPTLNLEQPGDDARGWVLAEPRPLEASGHALVTNAGFSGINTALVLGRGVAP